MTKAKKKSSWTWRIVTRLWVINLFGIYFSLLFVNYLWGLWFGEEVQTHLQLTQLPGGSLQGAEGFCRRVGAQPVFVMVKGIGNVEDTNADIWYS